MSPDSSKILFKIFQDSNIYSAKVRGPDGKELPQTNFAAQRAGSAMSPTLRNIVAVVSACSSFYENFNILFIIAYVLAGIYALIKDRHVCNVDMIHDSSDVWQFGAIYLVSSIVLSSLVEFIFAPWTLFRDAESPPAQICKMSIHAITSLCFFIYENKVMFKEGAMCDEIQGTWLYYWIYATYYILLFRMANYLIAVFSLCIVSINTKPKSEAELEKESLMKNPA